MNRSTPIKRTAFRRKEVAAASQDPPKARDGVCAHCGAPFLPLRPMQKVCSPICASRKVRADKLKERADTRQRKAALKRIPDLLKEAQHAFNAFIRERDRNQPCICCGKPLGGTEVGGGYDAGHYRSVGSAPHLRFDERNVHAQRKQCNRYGAGRAVDYRIGLCARLGAEQVEALESTNAIHKWQRDELMAIRDLYRQKLKELRAKE